MHLRLWVCLLSASTLALTRVSSAAEQPSWEAYIKANRYQCPGPLDTLASPKVLSLGGKNYQLSGYKLDVQSRDTDKQIKIGVVSAQKDMTEGTQSNVKAAMAWFKEAGVEWVVVNGDLALEELDLKDALTLVAEGGLPTLVTLGNSDSKSSFARVFGELHEKFPNIINGVLVRQLIADDAEFWTLSGYHDKAFVYQGAGCVYGPEAIGHFDSFKRSDAPVVLVSHGPPQGKGKDAIDFMNDKKNVGDPQLNSAMDKFKISFGLFGHILEAGGRAWARDMSTKLPEKKFHPQLYLNAGSISADPWGLNDGSTSYGMATIVTLNDGKASYEVKRFSAQAL